ncbi:hypothetical protein AJ88_35710 [Mesorhizobium amorphae CCBAU 01583]|nr:hypothetical protein AJ88_35710 [Mesorhizobium amorphae CCBAU 01583]
MTKILGDRKLRSAALLYIFHRLEDVIDGSPIMLFLDEGWKLLDDEVFAAFINETLKTILAATAWSASARRQPKTSSIPPSRRH